MEDSKKVQARLDKLNKGLPSKPWIAVNGNNVLPEATFNFGVLKFDNTRGYAVKIFINSNTGEMKIYAAVLFQV